MKIGDRVLVIPPHPESGAVGEVINIYEARSQHDEPRARVRFGEPYKGWQSFPVSALAVIPAKESK